MKRSLRVVHVVALDATGGAYGGPMSVAVADVKALRRTAFDVDAAVWSGWDGEAPIRMAEGLVHRRFRAYSPVKSLRFVGLVCPSLWFSLVRDRRRIDVLHIHLGRDLITTIAALIAILLRMPTVVQTHGMVMVGKGLHFRLSNLLLVPVLRRALAVLALTSHEESELRCIAGRELNIDRIPNGIDLFQKDRPDQPQHRVLFVSRLHPRKGLRYFIYAAEEMKARTSAEFVVAGPDEGDMHLIDESQVRSPGAVSYQGAWESERVRLEMADAIVYVLPSVGEVVPMSVLEAMSVGVPVIVTSDCGLAHDITAYGAGVVLDHTGDLGDQLVAAISLLVEDPELRSKMSKMGVLLVKNSYSIKGVAERLIKIYGRVEC